MTDYERGYHQGKADAMKAQKTTGFIDSKLNPIKRQWVELTDEEMKKTWYEMKNIMGWYSFQEIAKAVEIKLKEKNT